MNRCSAIIFALFFAVISAVAAERSESASLGDLVSALNKPERQARILALLDAWEAAPACRENVRKFLIRELGPQELSKAVIRKLERLWSARAEDPFIAYFVLQNLSGNAEERVFCAAQLDKTVHALDYRGEKADEEIQLTGELLSLYLRNLREKQEYESGKAFLQKITAAASDSCRPRLLMAEAEFYRDICFFEYDSFPGLKSWGKLAGRSWFEAYQNTLAELRKNEKQTGKNMALALLGFYQQNRERQSFMEYAEQLKKSFAGDLRFAELLITGAAAFEDPALYRQAISLAPQLKNTGTELLLSDDAAAEEIFRKLTPRAAMEMRIFRALVKKKYEQAITIFNLLTQKEKPSDLLIRGMLEASENKRDAALWRKLYAARSPAVQQDPSGCNGFGYVAAVLNIELDTAQKLLEFAVQAEPENPAYADSMAYLFYRKKEFAQAKKWIDRAIRLRLPGMPMATLLLHAAEITWQADHDPAAARKLLDRALFCAEDDDEFDFAEAKELQEVLK